MTNQKHPENETKLEVKLLTGTPDILKTIYLGHVCYSEETSSQIWDKNPTKETMINFAIKILESGHLSVFEHISFVWSISGMDRKTSMQLNRHRHMGISQKSQRYFTYNNPFKYTVSKGIRESEFLKEYTDLMAYIQDFYGRMLAKNIKPEDARDIFPNACETCGTYSMNLRELLHIINERKCSKAQAQIVRIATMMINEITKDNEWLKPYLGAKCKNELYCKELKSCGLKPTKKEVQEKLFRLEQLEK